MAKAQADLRDQGGRIRALDAFELKHAAKLGLVAESIAERELERRRKTFSKDPSRRLARGSFVDGGAVVGGLVPCGFAGCFRAVPAQDGGFCREHRENAPRIQFDARLFTSVNLDDLLADAQRRSAKARAVMDQAEAEIVALKQRIEVFDRNRDQPDDHDAA